MTEDAAYDDAWLEGNLDAMKLHAGHVIHAVDPRIEPKGPGLNYGVKRAALGVVERIQQAATTAAEAAPHVTQIQPPSASTRLTSTSATNSPSRTSLLVGLALMSASFAASRPISRGQACTQ